MAKILIVDDVPANRDYLVTLLGYGGHTLLEADDGAQGLAQTRAQRPDLVIADILMPTMDGFEFARQLRTELDPALARTPVIFYTAAYYEREARMLARDCGVAHIITKPSAPQAILTTVEAALGPQAVRPSAPAAPAGAAGEEFSREHLRLLTDKLSQKVYELEAVSMRLRALIEIGQQLAADYDAPALVAHVCRAARDLLGVKYASLGVLGADGRLAHFFMTGVSTEQAAQLSEPDIDQGVVRQLLQERRPLRVANPGGSPQVLGLPADHPPVYAFLGVPIVKGEQVYGWLSLRNKLSAPEFNEGDEQLGLVLAAQTAVAYESIQRYAEIQRHAAELEERVRARTFELQRSNQELEQFAYLASHDLQEPLRKVLGFSGLLTKRYTGRLDAEADEFIGYIVDAAGRMQDLIEDLLEYSRVGRRAADTAGPDGALEPVECEGLLAQVLETLSESIEATQAQVTHDPLPAVAMSSHELVQLFQNLIANAIKFHGPQPPRVHISAGPPPAEAGGRPAQPPTRWLFVVRDNGIGFDPQFSERIFGMFQRLHRREEYPGTGIGLAICRKVVERHGGRIWAESQPGQGATFFFTLPAAPGAPDTERS